MIYAFKPSNLVTILPAAGRNEILPVASADMFCFDMGIMPTRPIIAEDMAMLAARPMIDYYASSHYYAADVSRRQPPPSAAAIRQPVISRLSALLQC